jgi:hypothetical protein
MSADTALNAASFLACCVAAFAGLRAAAAFHRASRQIRPERLPAYLVNRSLPNPDDRDSAFDYVDQAAWADVSGAKMWGSLAALCVIAATIMLMVVS